MARPKNFDPDEALNTAISVFGDRGYAGASAEMLVGAMNIGKQSLYDTFGGKWSLYCAALERYSSTETAQHIEALRSSSSALGGIQVLLKRVVTHARVPCLGMSSVAEFGVDEAELVRIRESAAKSLQTALVESLREAQRCGDVNADLNVIFVASFIVANIGAIRLAARGGAGDAELRALASLALRALT